MDVRGIQKVWKSEVWQVGTPLPPSHEVGPFRELNVGCGKERIKRMGFAPEWAPLTTHVDQFRSTSPDVLMDASIVPYPFEDSYFDAIHLYHSLEHLTTQGDWLHWYTLWGEFHRIGKNGCRIFVVVPYWRHEWAWGDPGHRMFFQPASFLSVDNCLQSIQERSEQTPYTIPYHVHVLRVGFNRVKWRWWQPLGKRAEVFAELEVRK